MQGVALHDLDLVELDPENFVGDLGVGGLVPLPVRMGADVNLHFAISGQLDLACSYPGTIGRPRKPAPTCRGALFDEERDADPD